MERTSDFIHEIKSCAADDIGFASNVSGRCAPSPFLLKASDIFNQICSFRAKLHATEIRYVGYNRYLNRTKHKRMSVEERGNFNKETLIFISSMVTEIKHLRQLLNLDNKSVLQDQHNKEIVSLLSTNLEEFTSLWDQIQRRFKAFNVSPFRLLASTYNDITTSGSSNSSVISNASEISRSTNASVIKSTFAQRYVDEIAPVSKMNVYKAISMTHKESLMKESRILQVRFSDDMNESQRMEREVSRISQLLTQFVSMIDTQSEIVSDIHDAAKVSSHTVTSANEDLQITLGRTKAQQYYMVILVLGMAFLILLLDAITP